MSKRYHHIGLPAADQVTPIPGETYMEASDIWISSPDDHPQRIEWLRYGPTNSTPERGADSSLRNGRVRTKGHHGGRHHVASNIQGSSACP